MLMNKREERRGMANKRKKKSTSGHFSYVQNLFFPSFFYSSNQVNRRDYYYPSNAMCKDQHNNKAE